MAKKETDKTEMLGIRIPADLKRRLEDLAAANRRAVTGEAIIALENHVDAAEQKAQA